MAIPKEPRQLMINIMYLVLTALLALNVSAEIFNAFKVVDSGLKRSSVALDDSNSKLPAVIEKGAKKRPDLQQYADRIDGVRETSSEFTSYVQEMIDYMIDQTGDKDGVAGSDGDYVEYNGVKKLKGQKNKDVTTRYLVSGDQGQDPKGPELKAKIQETYEKFLEFVDEEDKPTMQFPLQIDDESWKATKEKAKRSWTAFNFRQMPLQATLPILNKFINDAKATEGEVLNYLLKKVGTDEAVVLDEFIVISSPKKSYIINGETYETELSLGAAASSKSNTKVSITVNGQPINIQDGKGKWSQKASGLGVKKYTAVARVTNPVTNETKSYTSEYEYEVGERSVTVSPSKMNVFYIGVDNPVEISAAGVATKDVRVSMSGPGGGTIERKGGSYNVRVKTPTGPNERAKINVTAPGLNEAREFRVKRIPNPEARLSTSNGGSMPSGTFKAQGGLGAFLDNFDFEATCQIKGFKLVYVPKRQDAQEAVNAGGKYGGEARRLIDQAKPGDVFYFDNVKATCPGDIAPRTINTLVFRIK
jgi:gliding motility-associated protein GldM